MAQISLRAYIREIDNLVERELLDEAIAHCRHILQIYPKNIEIYRLLGKSYLEAKRYGDAADIFQRVLSALPDDFVSHIGMSIVREDEGNLDSAIWHMERAFETNPANPAIQQELRRLIGRRDGFEPHKVRLTRGALARMYAQGELYSQAIAELQAALQEDPDRPDLQVLLADMFWQTGQKMEAADVSRQIIEKLPFCQRAARIMAAVHQEQGKSEEGTAYHRRLAQLDPYAAYVDYPMVDTMKVEADTIRIDRLDWRPGQPLPASEAGQPDWASSLGVELESEDAVPGSTGPLPSWLDDIQPGAEALQVEDDQPEAVPAAASLADEPGGADEADAEPAGDSIPNWMRDAGWQESSGEAVETPVSFSESELSSLERGELPPDDGPDEPESEDLTRAEIPSWLQGKRPSADAPKTVPAAPGPAEEEGEVPDWLEGISAEGEPSAVPEPESAQADLTPDWLGQLADEAEDLSAEAETPGFGTGDEAETEAVSAGGQGAVPGWLDEEPGATSTIMSWLGERELAGDDADEGQEPQGEAPDWMRAALQSEEPEPEAAPRQRFEGSESDDVPAWLSGVAQAAAESGFSGGESEEPSKPEPAETPAMEVAEAGGEVPDWLMSIAGGASAEETSQPMQEEASAAFDFETELADENGPATEPAATVPSWPSTPQDSTPGPGGDFPDEDEAAEWLENLNAISDEVEEPDAEAAAGAQGSATAWLEGLAESHEEAAPAPPLGAEEPEWMRGLEEEESGDEALGELASSWLEGLADTLAETPAEPEPSGSEAADEGVPNWLLEYETETETPAEPEPAEPSAEETFIGATAMFGLESPAVDVPETPAEEDTGRLKMLEELGLGEESTEAEAAAPPEMAAEYDVGQLEGMDDDQIFGWLEGLAARDQGEAPPESAAMSAPPAGAIPPQAEPEDRGGPAAEEDLGWLEELAQSRGLDSDVSAPAPPPTPVEPEPSQAIPEPTPEPLVAPPEPPEATIMRPPPAPPVVEEPAEPAVPAPAPVAHAEPIPEPPPVQPTPPEPEPAAPIPPEEAPVPEPVRPPETMRVPTSEPAHAPAGTDDGLNRARKALEGGDLPSAAEAYGALIKSRRELQAVVQDLKSALDQDPEASSLWQVLGDAYMKIGRTSEAVKAYNRGMKEAEVLVSARQALASGDAQRAAAQYGILIKRKKHLDEVITDLETAVAQNDDQPNVWQALGDAYMKADRLEDAIQAYRRGMGSV